MQYSVTHIRTQTATFRNPEFQNYHKSFLLPPPTTIVGLAGAALGLSPKAAQEFFDNKGFEMGIAGKTNGKANDLWKYRTSDEKTPTSVLTREIMYGGDFIIVFGHEDEQVIKQLAAAFESPYYAPVMGSSDSIAKIVRTFILTEYTLEKSLSFCLWEGNIIEETILAMENNNDPLDIFIKYKESMIYDLPVRFSYESDYGIRRISARRSFTFVGTTMILPTAVKGIHYEGRFAPLFRY